jgi:hypothetical protein
MEQRTLRIQCLEVIIVIDSGPTPKTSPYLRGKEQFNHPLSLETRRHGEEKHIWPSDRRHIGRRWDTPSCRGINPLRLCRLLVLAMQALASHSPPEAMASAVVFFSEQPHESPFQPESPRFSCQRRRQLKQSPPAAAIRSLPSPPSAQRLTPFFSDFVGY